MDRSLRHPRRARQHHDPGLQHGLGPRVDGLDPHRGKIIIIIISITITILFILLLIVIMLIMIILLIIFIIIMSAHTACVSVARTYARVASGRAGRSEASTREDPHSRRVNFPRAKEGPRISRPWDSFSHEMLFREMAVPFVGGTPWKGSCMTV